MVTLEDVRWAEDLLKKQAEAERKHLEAETKRIEAARKAIEQAKLAVQQRSAEALAFLEVAVNEFKLEFEDLKYISKGLENELKTEYAWMEIDFKLKDLKDLAQLKAELGRIDSEEKERIARLRTVVQACVFYDYEAEKLLDENRVQDAVKVMNVVEELIAEVKGHEEYLIKLEQYKEEVAEKHKKAEIEHGFFGKRAKGDVEAESFVVDKELLRVRKLSAVAPKNVQKQVAIDVPVVVELLKKTNNYVDAGKFDAARKSLEEAKNVLKTLAAAASKEQVSAIANEITKIESRLLDMEIVIERAEEYIKK